MNYETLWHALRIRMEKVLSMTDDQQVRQMVETMLMAMDALENEAYERR